MLGDVTHCSISRCYNLQVKTVLTTELHVFCDASQKAMATVGYWRFCFNNANHVAFVAAKSRVAPIKPGLTIPRMELQAALLGSRLACTIGKEHDIEISRRIFWTGARAVFCSIKSDFGKHIVWLSNRFEEIDKWTSAEEWRWVPTKKTPADDATRDTGKVPLLGSRWLIRPSFLQKSEEQWPHMTVTDKDYNNCDDLRIEVTTITIASSPAALPDVSRFSSWRCLTNSTARVLLFVDVCIRKVVAELTPECVQRAEELWIRRVQQECYGPELCALKKKGHVSTKNRLIQLHPIVDEDGILRVKGRTPSIINVAAAGKSPAILEGHHPYVRLLVMHYHQQAGHGTHKTVINKLRQSYWIVHARPTVRSVAFRSQWCRI